MKKKILAVFGTLCVTTMAAIWCVGSSLPVSHSASVSRIIVAEQQKVFAVISDFEAYPNWLGGTKSAVKTTDGATTRYTLIDSGGPVTYKVIELRAPTTLKTLIISKDLPYGGSWLITVESQPVEGDRNVSRVSIQEEEGKIYNPVLRFFAFYGFGYTTSMKSFLADLSVELEKTGISGRR